MTIEEVLNEGTLRCPVCGFDFNHVKSVYTRMGSDPSEAEVYDGTKSIGTVTDERRSCLVIEIECEESHRWELRLQQHKGQTCVQAEGVRARNRTLKKRTLQG
jgi:hypothetical protein